MTLDLATRRRAALLLVGGTLASLVTMAFHPTGHQVVGNAGAGRSNALASGVHLLAIVAQALMAGAALAIPLHLRARRDAAVLGYACYAIAGVAVVVAAIASGLVATDVLRGIAGADEAARAGMLDGLRYTAILNQAFARVHVVLAGLALALWSWALLADAGARRWHAALGLVAGPAMAVAAAGGWLRLDIHGFGLVVLLEGAWMAGAAAWLRRDR